jgi:hypothetical protein
MKSVYLRIANDYGIGRGVVRSRKLVERFGCYEVYGDTGESITTLYEDVRAHR